MKTYGVRDMYRIYIEDIEYKKLELQNKIHEVREKIIYLTNILYPYSIQIQEAGLNINLTNLESKISYTDKQINKVEIKVVTVDQNLIKSYIKALCKAKRNLAVYKDNLDKLNSYFIPFRIYSYILKEYNKKISHRMLLGYSLDVGANVGQIVIKKIRRIFNVGGKEATKNIDFGETKKLRKRLLDSGVEIFSKDNPKGQKYLVYYTSDYFYWYYWNRGNCQIPNCFLYTFTPTNFINTKSRSQIEFTNNAKNKEDIIETDLLGNRDKLYCLIRFDSSLGLNYVLDERESIS